MYIYLIQTLIIPEALCYILSDCFDRVFMCRQFFLNPLPLPETVDSNKKLYMGTDGLQLNIWKDQAQPSLGGRRIEAINKFHTFSVAGAHPSMQGISFDVSIKL